LPDEVNKIKKTVISANVNDFETTINYVYNCKGILVDEVLKFFTINSKTQDETNLS
jgi:hypothetical protein